MNVTSVRAFGGLFALVIISGYFFGPAGLLPGAAAQPNNDPRLFFVFDSNPKHYLKDLGSGKWAEYKDGKLERTFKEAGRNDKYIEITTDDPTPIVARLGTKGVIFRGVREVQWKSGGNGGWIENPFYFP